MKNNVVLLCTVLLGIALSGSLSIKYFVWDGETQQTTTSFVRAHQRRHQDQPSCEGVDGILLISRVIRKAGAGTMFFQSLVDSLLYADKYNLLPYIWINDDENKPCYDPQVHGIGNNFSFTHVAGNISNVVGMGAMKCYTNEGTRPGLPDLSHIKSEPYTLVGNGLWQSYFEPLATEFPWNNLSCANKPIFEFSRSQIMPDMHRCSDFAVRGWAFKGIPDALLPNDRPIADWLWDHRQRAAMMVRKYFQPQAWLEERVRQANPDPERCLAAHIRLTDKASGRDKKGLEVYKPYIEAYAKASDGISPIYIATDDGTVLETIQREWSSDVSSRIISQQGAFRAKKGGKIPTFKLLENDKHRSNTEALVEMYAMAQCSYFVHGYSGMAEAVVYLNPSLHTRSVNIDDPEKSSPKEFKQMVESIENSRSSA